jgi:hypothetical protein
VPTLSEAEMKTLQIKDTASLQQEISRLTDADELLNAWKIMVANEN